MKQLSKTHNTVRLNNIVTVYEKFPHLYGIKNGRFDNILSSRAPADTHDCG